MKADERAMTTFHDDNDGITTLYSTKWTFPHRHRPTGPTQPIPRGAHTPSSSIASTSTSSSSHTHSRSKSDFSLTAIGKRVDAQSHAVVAKILETDSRIGDSYLAHCQAKVKEKGKDKTYPPRVESRRALLSMANGCKAPILLRGPSTSSRIGIEKRGGQVVRVRAPPLPIGSNKSKGGPSPSGYLHKQLPPTPPLSAGSHEDKTISRLAVKRLSRAKNAGRMRAVPAPIRLTPVRGPSAFNGPCSAHTDEEEIEVEEDSRDVTMTPMGQLPITPLDIPVDWDDLEERWTSPEEDSNKGALEAFHKDVNKLFAHSPTINVRGSVDVEPEKNKEKRHGKVLKEPLKLRIEHGFKKGESFLMMNSPEC